MTIYDLEEFGPNFTDREDAEPACEFFDATGTLLIAGGLIDDYEND